MSDCFSIPIQKMLLHSKEVTPTSSAASSSSETVRNDDLAKSHKQRLRSSICDPVAMQLFHCGIEDKVAKKEEVDEQSKSSKHIEAKPPPQQLMTSSSDNSSAEVIGKVELIRNLSGSLSEVKSVEDLSLLARPIPQKLCSQKKRSRLEP